MLTVEESVTRFLTQYEEGLKRDQQQKRMVATGASAASLKVVVKKPVTGGQLTGSSYWVFQFDGRNPGGMPPIENITAWIQARHLNLNPWAVAKSIEKKGTLGLRDPNKRINIDQEAQRYKEELLANLGQAYAVLIVQELKEVSKTI